MVIFNLMVKVRKDLENDGSDFLMGLKLGMKVTLYLKLNYKN